MSAQRPTPGPWEVHKQTDTDDFYVYAPASEVFVCGDDEWGGGATEADARLIAEAPAMLALLRSLAGGNVLRYRLDAEARALLARIDGAKGETT